MRARTKILTLVVILSNVLGNVVLSAGLKRSTLDPLVVLGVALLILWMLSRMSLMSDADLSFILPVTALGYVLTALAGRFVLGETVAATRWAGTVLITAGAALVSVTPPRTS